MTEIRNHDVVKVVSTNKISRITDIHYAFDRYQINGVSGWQHGISNLEKLNTDSLITTIESQKEEIEKWKTTAEIYKDQDRWKANFEKVYTDRENEISRHAGTKIKLEDQKAITELAVKGLKSLISAPYPRTFHEVEEIVKNAVSEIERISHA